MLKRRSLLLCAAVFLACPVVPLVADGGPELLWVIGKDDNGNAEFALAPDGYHQFARDGFFVVGKSDARRDWPYVHPGPSDAWAGGQSHTFGIAFGLAAVPPAGTCRLILDLLDTQNAIPPRLRIEINGHVFEQAVPRGAGDASIYGQPETGRQYVVEIGFPAEILAAGNNHIAITTLSGSWVLYDWIGLESPAGGKLAEAAGTVVQSVRTSPLLVERLGTLTQTIRVEVLHFGPPSDAIIHVEGGESVEVQLHSGRTTVDVPTARVSTPTETTVAVQAGNKMLAKRTITIQPVRKWVVYLLPHSHVDIGYTHVQTEVEQSHWKFYEQAIEASRKTADYPPGAQFKWNVEVLWATDSYLRQASPEKREEFMQAVKAGWVGLDALYGNQLTALCRPEELVRLVDYANRLRRQYDVPISSAMISDVPGYTWGIVPVLAASGVKYFSIGPNGGHRIGYTLSEYGDKPFWWRSPCGDHRVLCWIPRTGYWRGFQGEEGLLNLLKQMEESRYPYDLVQIRHCLGDNAGPGLELSEFVKEWSSRYAYPKLVIATTAEMMGELERRYGAELPELRGDFTPYWEDGAGSSARETALNRAAAERLVQAETLFTMLRPADYPDEAFYQAWRNVILYDEHTWGAHCSISQPESDFTKAQWAIKQRFALDADTQSQQLMTDAAGGTRPASGPVQAMNVFNTCSWPRTDLVTVPRDVAVAGDVVKDSSGTGVPSQRLSTGELVFLAKDVPPLASSRFTFATGAPDLRAVLAPDAAARIEGSVLSAGPLKVTVDPQTGAIANLTWHDHDFAAHAPQAAGPQINGYHYVAGRNPDAPKTNGPVTIAVKEQGPLVASLVIASDAPGCRQLTRQLTVIGGAQRLDIANTVDKQNIYEQEAVHFSFPFHVPDGVIRMDIPWAVAQVEVDQLPGACKNYFTVQRWVDVANQQLGVTLATVDAPLFEVGQITCDPIAVGWIRELPPTQTLYSYVMNNYWETNYKASQEGPTVFRYSIQPHGEYCPAAAQRFGIERSQPLIAVPGDVEPPAVSPLVSVDGKAVILTALKPAADRTGTIIRLFNTTGDPAEATLRWRDPVPRKVEFCDLSERAVGEAPRTISLGPWQMVTLRATP